MKKNCLVLGSLCLTTAFAVVGCGERKNTNMVVKDASVISPQKWDKFASTVGLPGTSEAASVGDRAALTSHLTVAPSNFVPSADGLNAAQYQFVVNAVNTYVSGTKNADGSVTGGLAQKTQATQIVSIQNYGVVLNSSYTANKSDVLGFNSIPFVQRDGKTVDLSGIKTSSGIDKNGKFKIYGTVNGMLNKQKVSTGTVYLVTYQLKNNGNQNYTALVTIPDTIKLSQKFPLMLYAHGGDAGLNFRQIALNVQSDLGNVILAAPAFPGEPICAITTNSVTRSNGFLRSCGDGNEHVLDPAVPPQGAKSPMDDDVNSLLGLQNALAQLASPTVPKTFLKDSGAAAKSLQTSLQNTLSFYADNKRFSSLLNPYVGPQTIAAGESRGGGTLLAAMGREGIIINNDIVANLSAKKPVTISPTLFSSAVLYYAPTSFLVGPFRLITQYMLGGQVNDRSSYNALPMMPEFRKNEYITNYRTASLTNDTKELSSLVGWIGASDITYLAPYISVSTQNWGVNIDSLLDAVDLEVGPFLKIINASSLGAAIIGNVLTPYLDDLTKVVPGTTNNKSMLGYFADALGDTTNSALDKCAIVAGAPTGDCSVRGLMVKGMIGGDLSGTIVPDLPPLLATVNDASVDSLINFLRVLGDPDAGLNFIVKGLKTGERSSGYLKAMSDILDAYNSVKVNLVSSDLKSTLPSMLATFGFVSFFSALDPYMSDTSKLPESSDVSNFASSIFNNDFSDGDGQYPNALKHYQADLANPKNLKTLTDNLVKQLEALLPKVLSARKAAPGSIIFMHGTQDKVVPFTESLIGKAALDAVFDNVYGTSAATSPLVKNNIPAVGSQLYSFQPDVSYYNIPVGTKDMIGNVSCTSKNTDSSTPVNYSTTANMCFGDFSPRSTSNTHHADASFRNSHLLNGFMQGMNVDLTGTPDSAFNQAMLSGADSLNYRSANGSVQEQFAFFNSARSANGKGDHYPYREFCTLSDKSGVCYLSGAVNDDGTPIISALALYNRTMNQDKTANFAPMFTGVWDPNAQSSTLTPSDVFSAWLNTVAIKSILLGK